MWTNHDLINEVTYELIRLACRARGLKFDVKVTIRVVDAPRNRYPVSMALQHRRIGQAGVRAVLGKRVTEIKLFRH